MFEDFVRIFHGHIFKGVNNFEILAFNLRFGISVLELALNTSIYLRTKYSFVQ